MIVQDIYTRYEIMPQLVTHMLRVAGVAQLITNDWEGEIADVCVNLCLLHDLGNIVKFKLGQEYENMDGLNWLMIQRKYHEKYGHEAHEATKIMLDELELTEYVRLIDKEAEFFHIEPTRTDFEKAPLPAILLLYTDLRVVPEGVVSLNERIEDLERRYGTPRAERQWGSVLEQFVQEKTNVKIEQITDADVEPLFPSLLTREI